MIESSFQHAENCLSISLFPRYDALMNEPAPPSPFEKFKALTAQIIAVPREEIKRREEAWKKDRDKKRAK